MDAIMFPDSVILARISRPIVTAFLASFRAWLPGRERFRLLYRSRRDGATPAAFHGLCDGQGATVTVMVSSSGHTFGGYAEVPWSSPAGAKWAAASDSFLFSIVNPHGDAPTRFPLSSKPHPKAVCYNSCYGPVFGNVLMCVGGDGSSPASVFGSKAEYIYIRNPLVTYKDESGRNRGSTTFTDTTPDPDYASSYGMFKLSEIEVWAVSEACTPSSFQAQQ